jgi:hypothetical protein
MFSPTRLCFIVIYMQIKESRIINVNLLLQPYFVLAHIEIAYSGKITFYLFPRTLYRLKR